MYFRKLCVVSIAVALSACGQSRDADSINEKQAGSMLQLSRDQIVGQWQCDSSFQNVRTREWAHYKADGTLVIRLQTVGSQATSVSYPSQNSNTAEFEFATSGTWEIRGSEIHESFAPYQIKAMNELAKEFVHELEHDLAGITDSTTAVTKVTESEFFWNDEDGRENVCSRIDS